MKNPSMARRDARILLAAGLALCGVGLVVAPWGFVVASELPRIEESSSALSQEANQGVIEGILPENISERIAKMRILIAGVAALGVLCAAGGVALILSVGRSALEGI